MAKRITTRKWTGAARGVLPKATGSHVARPRAGWYSPFTNPAKKTAVRKRAR